MPLKTDSITFRNCAPHGKGISSTSGVIAWRTLYASLLNSSTASHRALEACQDAESQEAVQSMLIFIGDN